MFSSWSPNLKVLVTGGAGFIGSNLVDELVRLKYNVDVLDDFSTGIQSNKNDSANYIIRSINDDLKDIGDYEVIFHLAAMARIQPSFDDPLNTIDLNVRGTANICDLAIRNKSKLVYAGSSSIYGGKYLNPYAFSKWQGEEICKMYSGVYGLSTAVARFFNVYGPRHLSEGPYATVIGIFERQIINDNSLTITGDGNQRRDFTHVNDIVDGLILMSKDNWFGEIFNLGTGVNHSINEIAKIFNHRQKFISKRPGEAKSTLADISFSRDRIGYEPKEVIEDYIRNWRKKNILTRG